MNTDIRIAVSFKGHRKRKRLRMMLGPGSTDYLIDLWISTAMNHPDGTLVGMDEVDIALEAGWEGDAGEFISALMKCGFLECEDGLFFLHDWPDHQAYVVHAEARKEKAKIAAAKRWEKRSGKQEMQNGCYEYASSTNQALPSCDLSNAPSPSPSPSPTPSPSPSPKEVKDIVGQGCPTAPAPIDHQKENTLKPDPVPYAAIIAKLNEVCGCQFKASTQATRRHIKARWNEGWRLPDFEAVVIAKFAEWGSDAEMCRFLRPETLFGTKFESYLQFAKNGGGAARPMNESTAPANQDELVRKIREQRAERERKALEGQSNATTTA